MTDKTDGVLADLDREILCCRAHSEEPLLAIRAKVAELLAAAERVVVADDAEELDGEDIDSLRAAIRAMRGDE